MSGSDDGRIYIWNKKTGKLLNVVRGDKVMEKTTQEHCKDALTLLHGLSWALGRD